MVTVDMEPAHELMVLALDYAEDAESGAASAQQALKTATQRLDPKGNLDQAEKRLHATMDDAERALQKVQQAREMLGLHEADGDEPAVPETDYMAEEDG